MAASVADPRVTAQRIEGLLGELSGTGDPRLADAAEELVRLLMQLYGSGLSRVMELAALPGDGAGLVSRIIDDELLSSLLVLHDLHPIPLAERVTRAIDKVRPYLGSHGGGVQVEAIEDGVVRLRMEGSCSGCPSSAITLNYALERAILEAAPEIARVEAVEEDGGVATRGANGSLVQIDGLSSAPVPVQGPVDWTTIQISAGAVEGRLASVHAGGQQLILFGHDGTMYAYRDRCGRCGQSLASADVAGVVVTCPTCATTFDMQRAGRATEGGQLHLQPLPLIVQGGDVQVALPQAVASHA